MNTPTSSGTIPPSDDSISNWLKIAETACLEKKITTGALENIRQWLIQPRYQAYRRILGEHLENSRWKELDDAFWTIIPFGTGGRRGRMYPIGSNAINDRTIGESAQGLAEYVLEKVSDRPLRCAIAYDTRHRSRHFAELCASILVANGFTVYFLDDYRATPQLSQAVRMFQCHCGIMVTASHNPPSDNAVKVYWSTGGQIVPPDDAAIIDRVMKVDEIRSVDFAQACVDGKVMMVTNQVDAAYLKAAGEFAFPGSRNLKLLYSPLHGVGSFAVPPLLRQAGFEQIEMFGPHAEPNGDFPNVPGHVSNPENPPVFEAMIAHAKHQGHRLILATDPDCDRMGCAAPETMDTSGPWRIFNGNEIGALLADFMLRKFQELGKLTRSSYVIKTLVTTDLTRKIAEAYQARCEGNIHVGFKWIAQLIDAHGPDSFVFGTEESHGYLVGQYARDKDGAVACLLMAQLAAELAANGRSLSNQLDALHRQHGVHLEDLLNVQMEGSEGMEQMKKVMAAFRDSPPKQLGDSQVLEMKDYQSLQTLNLASRQSQPLDSPKSNMVMLNLGGSGNAVAVRPSGTEPKVKFYFFGVLPPSNTDLTSDRQQIRNRIDSWKKSLKEYIQQVIQG
ncbi:MAG: phospho-sugar mutase [Pirellulaceae bacterium]|jgi:phosphoglucomutase/phosphomannomutase